MGISYLDDKFWKDITREERAFCSHLYQELISDDRNKFKEFIRLLNKEQEPKRKLSETEDWEIGFEVCFYRDMFYKFGEKEIRSFNNDSEEYHFPEKRTFDLCLFSDSTLVVIEAKAYSEFDNDQIGYIERDFSNIDDEFDFKNKKSDPPKKRKTGIKNLYLQLGQGIKPPQRVFLVFLRSSSRAREDNYFKGRDWFLKSISWNDLGIIEPIDISKAYFERANKVPDESSRSGINKTLNSEKRIPCLYRGPNGDEPPCPQDFEIKRTGIRNHLKGQKPQGHNLSGTELEIWVEKIFNQ